MKGNKEMNKIIAYLLGCLIAMMGQSFVYAQSDVGKMLDAKIDKAENYLQNIKTLPNAWSLTMEIADFIKQHPEYDDGEYAEGMNDLVTRLLMKPWKYASPYLTGKESTSLFRQFIIDHINELSSIQDLKIIKKNVIKNCNSTQFIFCKKLIEKINQSMQPNL